MTKVIIFTEKQMKIRIVDIAIFRIILTVLGLFLFSFETRVFQKVIYILWWFPLYVRIVKYESDCVSHWFLLFTVKNSQVNDTVYFIFHLKTKYLIRVINSEQINMLMCMLLEQDNIKIGMRRKCVHDLKYSY